MNSKSGWFFVFFVLIVFAPAQLVGGKFGEHKKIGDEAFKRFLQRYHLAQFFQDTLDIDTKDGTAALFSNIAKGFTYGDLTGLSADHGLNPFEIYLSLASNRSKLSQTIRTHLQAVEQGTLGAEDLALTKIDLFYPLKAIVDQAHFYALGKTMDGQLGSFDGRQLANLDSLWADTFTRLEDFFTELLNTNSPAKYSILHSAALQYMYYAGLLIDGDEIYQRRYALEYFERGLLFNAFADHYLQDMFAAGHLAVKRSISRALDNMGTHDYYCRNGLDVRNLRGDAWKTYGDGFIEETTYRYAVLANEESLNELWQEFLRGRNYEGKSIINELRDHSNEIGAFLQGRFRAFQIVPIPLRDDEIKFANSRNGLVYSILGEQSVRGAGQTTIGAAVGFGFNLRAPKQGDAGKESVLWLGFHTSYRRNRQWQEATLGAEAIARDLFSLELNVGKRFEHNGPQPWILSPALGIEYKPISWSLAPSLKLVYTLVSHEAPAYALRLAVRYY